MPGNRVELFQMGEDTWYPYIATARDEMQTNPIDNESSTHTAMSGKAMTHIPMTIFFDIVYSFVICKFCARFFHTFAFQDAAKANITFAALYYFQVVCVFFFPQCQRFSPIALNCVYICNECAVWLLKESDWGREGWNSVFSLYVSQKWEAKRKTHSCNGNTIRWNELNERTMLFS